MIGPLETISINFALLPNFDCLLCNFLRKFSPKNLNLLMLLIPFNSKVKQIFLKKKVLNFAKFKMFFWNMQIQKSLFWDLDFLIFPFNFWFKTYQWLRDIQGIFPNMNFAWKHFLRGWKIVGEPSGVSENFGYWEIFCIRGAYLDFLSNFLCLST